MFGAKKFGLFLLAMGCLSLEAGEEDAFGLRGSISMDYRTEVVNFSLKVGDRSLYYKVEGFTRPDKGVYLTESDFDGISVTKREVSEGRSLGEESLQTEGSLSIYPRKRRLNRVTLAGVPLKGEFLQGALNDGIFLEGLEVDGNNSTGLLDYNNFVGYYRSKRGLRFGDTPIVSTQPGSNVLSNLDNYIGQNRNRYTWGFGDLKLEGLAYFSDSHVSSTDSEGDTTTVTVATLCRYDLKISRIDGKAIKLSGPKEAPTDDDVKIKKLLAMWILFAYDMHRP